MSLKLLAAAIIEFMLPSLPVVRVEVSINFANLSSIDAIPLYALDVGVSYIL